ncbi:unnamed protein product [Didymodactylos carnosus]|uniref:Uncharacterized protein n=1 Tax=Didymodactylos carnosus TaxID=1234261 RepID=A0A814LJM8_9BILA|nr:unnamed protein product [Didymodactylos carnosus]CAF3833316.1 unnamed protein product [Didymodactylos carnosus]
MPATSLRNGLSGVPESGPLNVHFVRDVGCIFFISGVGLLIAAFSIEYRLPLFTINTSFYMMHMFVHIHEVISGRLRPGIFWTDLPGIYLPAAITMTLNVFMIKKKSKQIDEHQFFS